MTDIIEEIRAALLLANPNDLELFKRYLKWMMIRKQVNHRFYFQAHWITRPLIYHWIGKA